MQARSRFAYEELLTLHTKINERIDLLRIVGLEKLNYRSGILLSLKKAGHDHGLKVPNGRRRRLVAQKRE